jgi:serine/threonine-protein kinase
LRTKPAERARSFPAVCVNHLAAARYAEDSGGRLPTEAEWEYAAKSCHSDFLFAWGNQDPWKAKRPMKVVLFNPKVESYGPQEVGTSEDDQTEQHVFDLTGNVREWCVDAYQPYNKGKIASGNSINKPVVDPWVFPDANPSEPGKYRVVRGGSFRTRVDKAMACYRSALKPDQVDVDIGFRVVLECPPERRSQP